MVFRRRLRVLGEAGGGAAGVVGLAGIPGVQDALVADGEQAGQPQVQRGEAGEAAPASGDVAGGGVLDGGKRPLGAGAAGVGPAVGRGRVVVFLPGLGRDLRGDGDGLLGAAGWRMLGQGEDLGAAAAAGHRAGPERAADLAGGGGAGDAVVAVGVIGGDLAEFVPG